MPKVQLASQRVKTQSAGAQASPVLLSGNAINRISAPRISAPSVPLGAAKTRFTPLPVPEIQKDTLTATLEGAADFSTVAVDAAMKYQERENKVYATHAAVGYETKLRELLYGTEDEEGNYQKGYLATNGAESIGAHKNLQQSVDELYEETLNNLEPAVRQKAMLSLSSSRDTALSKAATHRAGQLQVAEENAQYERRQSTVLEISVDPSAIYRKDKATGLTGKQKFYSEFSNKQDADKAWYDLITEVGEKIYLENGDQGYAKAVEFYQKTAQVELAMSPTHATRMMANIVKWENETIRKENSTRELNLKLAERAEKDAQQKTFANLWTRHLDPDNQQPITKAELAQKTEAGLLTTEQVKVINQEVFGEIDDLADPAKVLLWRQRLSGSVVNGFWYTDENGEKKTWSRGYLADPSLDPSTRSELRKFEDGLRDPNTNKNYTRGTQQLESWLMPDWAFGNMYDPQIEQMKVAGQEELFNRLRQGEDYQSIIDSMKQRYSFTHITYQQAEPFSTGVKPANKLELLRQGEIIAQKKATGSYATEEEYEADMRRLKAYQKLFQKFDLLRPIDETKESPKAPVATTTEKVINTAVDSATESASPPPTESSASSRRGRNRSN